MPYRNNDGSHKISAESKAKLLNMMCIGTNYHHIVVRGEVVKINIKEIFDERPDL